jgi:hypothetical protein
MPVGHGLAYGGDETGAIAIGYQLIDFFVGRRLCLAARKLCAPRGQTGQRGAIF